MRARQETLQRETVIVWVSWFIIKTAWAWQSIGLVLPKLAMAGCFLPVPASHAHRESRPAAGMAAGPRDHGRIIGSRSNKPGLAGFRRISEFAVMKIETEAGRMAWQIVEDCRIAVLTTADKEGWPHTTWMNFQVKGYLDEIFSITAPTTQKVANLRENPRAEWMLSNPSLESVVSLSGETRVIEGEEVRPFWDAIPGKARAYYRQYNDTDDFRKFVVISTKVGRVTLSHPAAYRKIVVTDGLKARPS